MRCGRLGCELAVLGVLCILSIFLFPAASGPYSVIHGPVTALQAVRSAARLRMAMIAAALTSFAVAAPLTSLLTLAQCIPASQGPAMLELSTILRC